MPEPDGMIAVIDTALADHPDVAELIRAGEDRYLTGVYRYTQQFLQLTSAPNAYTVYRDYTNGILAELIRERAGSAPQR